MKKNTPDEKNNAQTIVIISDYTNDIADAEKALLKGDIDEAIDLLSSVRQSMSCRINLYNDVAEGIIN
ncbi:MAG: hypothetical protein KTR20_03465 [Cellvibrionaceae bacterium]|nr:hypothetical protein [Cellvibrionaceae bacterium]